MKILSLFRPSYPRTIIYMLQSVEYRASLFLGWYWRTADFGGVMYRRELDGTPKATLLLSILWAIKLLQVLVIAYLLFTTSGLVWMIWFGWLVMVPVISVHILLLPLAVGTLLWQKPVERRRINQASQVFANFGGIKIAVLGSFGKTSTKELLAATLDSKFKVGYTSDNLNTPLALADFALKLSGDEEVLVIELGEFRPGDIAEFAAMVQPSHAVVTGLNSSHLDTLGNLDTAAANLLSVAEFVSPDNLFVNTDSELLKDYAKTLNHTPYSRKQALGWKVSQTKSSLDGTAFKMKKSNQQLNINSQLLGLHNVAKLALSAALARQLGCSKKQVETALAATKPVEHRLEPHMVGGATILDDTYNGNIDGVIAAVKFVEGLKVKFQRRIYVTPGLVEQGELTEENHILIGRAIAPVFDEVVLMRNSVTPFIEQGLEYGGFAGKLTLVDDPLGFYQQLDKQLAKGDLVLMQNDWTDNYA